MSAALAVRPTSSSSYSVLGLRDAWPEVAACCHSDALHRARRRAGRTPERNAPHRLWVWHGGGADTFAGLCRSCLKLAAGCGQSVHGRGAVPTAAMHAHTARLQCADDDEPQASNKQGVAGDAQWGKGGSRPRPTSAMLLLYQAAGCPVCTQAGSSSMRGLHALCGNRAPASVCIASSHVCVMQCSTQCTGRRQGRRPDGLLKD